MARLFPWLAALATLELGGILLGAAGSTAIDAAPEPLPAPLAPKAVIPTIRAPVLMDAMLQRPLFAASRKPFRPEPARAPGPASLPRLTGLVLTGTRREAIFAAPNGSKPLVVREGDRLGVFTVAFIRTQEVGLTGPLGQQTLRTTADIGLRSQVPQKLPVVAMITPARREQETESDQ